MDPDAPPFRSAVHLAEVATAGVRFNLAVGDPVAATALQPVARAAWELVDDPTAGEALRRAALDALLALESVCGATAERRFLEDVLVYVEKASVSAPPAGPARKIPPSDG